MPQTPSLRPDRHPAALRARARAAEPAELVRRRHLVMNAGEHLVDAGLIEGVNAAWISEYPFGDDPSRLRAASLVALPALGNDESVALKTELLDPAKARRRSVMLDPASQPPAPAVAGSFSDREAWKRTRQYR